MRTDTISRAAYRYVIVTGDTAHKFNGYAGSEQEAKDQLYLAMSFMQGPVAGYVECRPAGAARYRKLP